MSKLEEAIMEYNADLQEFGMDVNADLLASITKSLGPSIYLADASLVSCSDPEELARVKNNFLIGKLGMADGPELDAALKTVCSTYTKHKKSRAVFYYMLVKNLGKEAMFS